MKQSIRTLLLVILALSFAASAGAQTMKEVVARSFYSDQKAFEEGDVITIEIVEFARGTNATNTSTNSDNRIDADASSESIPWIPSFGLSSQLRNRHEAEGEITTKGQLESRMTAIVTEVADNGLLTIQGSRTIEVNGESQMTTLTGMVRPEDVSSGNTVFSYNIANAQISYSGKGLVTEGGKPGVIARVWNWIF